MLRITIHHETTTIRFIVEGRLTGLWVEELRKCWQTIRRDQPNAPLFVDLSAMTLIDAEGKSLLAEMHRQSVSLAATGLMTQTIVEEITGKSLVE